MRKMKSFVTFLILSAFLAATVFVPPMISVFKDRLLLGEVTTQDLITSEATETLSMTVMDKIALISGYNRSEDRFVMISQDQRLDSFNNTQNISGIASEKLDDLIDKGILPPIEIGQGTQLNKCVLKTYANMDQPNQTVMIWDIVLISGGYTVDLIIDIDTHVVYQIFISSGVPMPPMNMKTVSQKFSDYLGLTWDKKFEYGKSGISRYSAENGRIDYLFVQPSDGYGFCIQIATGNTVINGK